MSKEEASPGSTTASGGSASKFGMLGALISVISVLTIFMIIFQAFPGSEVGTWPFPGLLFVIHIVTMVIGIVGVTLNRSWGYLLSAAALLSMLLISGDILTFFRPASDTLFFIMNLIAIVAPLLSIPFGIQGFREARGKATTTKGAKTFVRILGIIALGFVLGGSVMAVIASPVSPSPGGDGSSSNVSVSLSGPPDITQTIRMENVLFDPQEITVSVGDNVLLIIENIDLFLHDFSVEGLDIFVENQGGQTSVVGFTADQLGSFPFICTVPGHREAGMEGIIRIQA